MRLYSLKNNKPALLQALNENANKIIVPKGISDPDLKSAYKFF